MKYNPTYEGYSLGSYGSKALAYAAVEGARLACKQQIAAILVADATCSTVRPEGLRLEPVEAGIFKVAKEDKTGSEYHIRMKDLQAICETLLKAQQLKALFLKEES